MAKRKTLTETIDLQTQRESIVKRPHNLAGSVERISKERFKITPNDISLTITNIVPALLKLFMESLDNPIDVAIKGGCKHITIHVTSDTITVEDDGYGISSAKHANGKLNLYNAMCEYNSSSNYSDEVRGKGQKGTNGIGIKLCTTLSTWFKAVSDDGKKVTTVIATDNNLNHKVSQKKSTKKTGTTISFKPDFNLFEVNELDQEHIDRMYEYTLIQALTYPQVTFKFNNKIVKYTPKQFISLLGDNAIIESQDDYFFAILPNPLDDFRQISFVNGLETSRGGSHITVIVDAIVNGIRTKLIKKHKAIKLGDIRNKLQFVLVAKNMEHIKWDGQTKESITSPNKQMREYFNSTDIDEFVGKVLKNKEIIESITELFTLKEQLKSRKELSALDKPKKKIKSEKYLPAITRKKYLMVTEGASATGGLLPVLGRDLCGFYELKGKPLNAYSASSQKFIGNKELSELYQILQNEGYEYLIYATDQDLDGIHIRGLLNGFIHRYLPEWKGRVGILNTPVIIIMKNKKPQRWTYNLNDVLEPKHGETSKYFKGLGTHTKDTLKPVIKKDGLNKMIDMLVWDNDEIIDDWLSDKKADKRKEYLIQNEFSIAKI